MRIVDKYFIFLFLILAGLSFIKSYYFGLEILTDTPITTFFKSSVKYIQNSRSFSNLKVPKFNDKISNSSKEPSFQKHDLLKNHRNRFNVILILLETTNYKIFSDPQNFNRILPNLSKLKKQSIVLNNFYSPYPRSSKSFFAALTGHYPLTTYQSIIKSYPHINIPDIFSILKNNGYKTYAGYSGNFNYDRMADFLRHRGVDKLVDVTDNDGFYKQISWCADDMLIYKQLFSWISTLEKSERFFSLLIPMNTHHPFWTPSAEYKIVSEITKIDRYKNAIHYQDYLIGELINFLESTERFDNTVIIITGDHGPMFNMLESNNGSLSPYLINKSSVHVPFFLYGPFTGRIGKGWDIIGSHVDILPTVLDILDIRHYKEMEGRSLFDENIKNRINYIYLDYYHHIVSGITNEFKMMIDFDTGQKILSKTMSFNNNLCIENKEVCEELTKKVLNFKEFHDKRIFSKLNS